MKKGLIASAVGISISWLLLIMLGAILKEVPLINNDPIATFVNIYVNDPIAYAIFLTACVAALLSTADAYVIAAVQSFYRDIVLPAQHGIGIIFDGSVDQIKKITVAFVLIPPFVIFGTSLIVPDILGLFFLVFSAQIALLPSVFVGLVKRRSVKKMPAIASMLSGLSCSLGIFVYSIFTGDQSYFFWSPLLTIVSALVGYLLFRHRSPI